MNYFLSGRKNEYFPWESEVVSKTDRNSFCDDENLYFLLLKILLPSFTNLHRVANVDELTQISNLLRGQILENRVLQNSNHKDPRTMVLVWDTGDSHGLTLFSSDFIDYVKCDIPVKDVTKVELIVD